MFWCDGGLHRDSRGKRSAREERGAFSLVRGRGDQDGDSEEKSCCCGGFHGMLRLINGLIKKSGRLYEAYTFCRGVIPSPQIVLLL